MGLMMTNRNRRIKRMRDELNRVRNGEESEPQIRMTDMELFRKMGINTRPN